MVHKGAATVSLSSRPYTSAFRPNNNPVTSRRDFSRKHHAVIIKCADPAGVNAESCGKNDEKRGRLATRVSFF